MADTILFTDVGEGIHEGKLVKWLVKEGDAIQEDQPLCEIETDKAVVEIPSSKTGTVLKLHAEVGATLHVGDALVSVGTPGEKTVTTRSATTPESTPASDTDKPEPTPVQTQKPMEARPQPAPSGRILAPPAVRKLATELKIDLSSLNGSGPNGMITESDVRSAKGALPEKQTPQASPTKPMQTVTTSPAAPGRILAPPSVRKLAFELGVDLNRVKGSGPSGRISEQDVLNFGKTPTPASAPQEPPQETAQMPQPAHRAQVFLKSSGPEIRIPLNPIRKIIAQRLGISAGLPHVTHVDEADVTDLWLLREREKSKALDKGVKLTLLPFVVKAVMKALVEFPTFNAALDEEKQESVLRKYYHAGIATDTPEGLMVPVVRDADKKSVFQIAKEIQSLSELARQKSLKPDELSGSTFTITNIGSAGGIYATPLINPPEAAILGVMRMQVRPAYDREGNLHPRNFLPLCLTFDHRLNDGAKSARFVAEICKHLENPESLLVGDI